MEFDEILFNIVVRIKGIEEGTGFYIDENRLITAYHVVKKDAIAGNKVKIINDVLGDEELLGEVSDFESQLDIAIIKVDSSNDMKKIPILIKDIYEGEEWRSYTCFSPYDGSKNSYEKEMIKGKVYQNEKFREQVYDIHLGGEYLSKAGMYCGFGGCSGTPLIIDKTIVGIVIKEEQSERDAPLKVASFVKFEEFFKKNKIIYDKKKRNMLDIFKLMSSDNAIIQADKLPQINLLFDEYNNNVSIEIPQKISSRKEFVNDIVSKFCDKDLLNIYGFVYSGKTILSALIAHKINRYMLYIDLKDVQSNHLIEYINNIFRDKLIESNCYSESELIIEQICKLINKHGILILDNFNIKRSDKSFSFICSLLNTCKKYNMKVIVISINDVNKLQFQSKGIRVLLEESRNLDKNDIIEILNEYKLAYKDIHINLIYDITGGKPSLVYTLFEYLKNNNWEIFNRFEEIFKMKFTDGLQEDIQDRIMDLIEDEDAKELLYRIALISFPYKFQLIEKIAQIAPNIVHINEKLSKLGGWINKNDQIYCNASLLDRVAEKNLNHEIKIEVHKTIADSIFEENKVLDYINFNRGFIHLVKAEENNRAGLLLCNALNSLKDSNVDADYWHILDLWNELECPKSVNVEIKIWMCVLQIICCDKFHKDNNKLFIRLDGYIKEIIESGCNEKLVTISLLLTYYPLKDVDLSMKYLKILIDNSIFDIFDKYKDQIDVDDKFGVEQILFVCSINIKTKKERETFFEIYDTLNDKQKKAFNSLRNQDIYDMSLAICSKVWLNEVNGEENFDDALRELESLESRNIFKDNRWFFINNKKCQIILLGEYLKSVDKAEIIAKELLESDLCNDKSVEFLIRDVIGKQFSIANNFEKAQLYLNNLSLDFEGFELEKIDYLNQYSIIQSKNNEHELALEELEDAFRLIDRNKLPYLEKLKNLGEQIIEYWFKEDNNSMYEKIKEYIDLIEKNNSEELTDLAKSLVLCLGHCTGYYSSILTRGKPPINCSDESPYVEPFRGIFFNDDGTKACMYNINKFALIYSHIATIAEVLRKYDEAKMYYIKSANLYNLKNGVKGIIERSLLKYEIMDKDYDKIYNLTISQSENLYFNMNKDIKVDIILNIGNDIFKFFIIPSIFNVLNKYIINDTSYINDSIKIVELIKKQDYIKEEDILIISEIFNQNIINEYNVNIVISKLSQHSSSLLLIKNVSLIKIDLKRNLREALKLQLGFEDYLKQMYADELIIYNIIKSTLETFWVYAYCQYRYNFKNTSIVDEKLQGLLKNKDYELKELLDLMNLGLN